MPFDAVESPGGISPPGAHRSRREPLDSRAVAWTNAAGEEGASSVPATITVSGSSFSVQTTTPANVKGWNVYCGTSATTMTVQNPAILAPGQTWVQPNTLSTTGRLAGSGQTPTYRLPVPRTIQRG